MAETSTPISALAPHPDSQPGHWYGLPRAVFSGGNAVSLLRGGDALFPAMHEAVAVAQRDVWLASYIFHDDPTSLALADALAAAAQRGIEVQVVVDGFGSKATLAALRARLEPAGVKFAVFRPVHGWWSWLQPGQLRRLHQKLCVVDGAVAFVGGINILDDRLDLHHGWSEAPRLDYAVRISGPSVEPIEQTVRAVWARASLGRRWREELAAMARAAEPVAQARRLWRTLRFADGRLISAPDEHSQAPIRAAFVVRDNLRQRRTIERAYVEAIRGAQRRVDLVCPYFYPGRAFRRALRGAARRGVQVRLLMQGRWDYRAAALAARAMYAEMLGRGVHVHEYGVAFLHAKVAVVDDDWSTVGSSNIDPLSLLLNLEANLIVRDTGFTASLASEIDAAFAEAREITEAEVGGRVDLLRRAFVAWCARIFLRVAGSTGRY